MASQQPLYQVTLIRGALEAALQQLIQAPRAVAVGQAGLNRTAHLTELICRELRIVHSLSSLPSAPAVLLGVGEAGTSRIQPRLQGFFGWNAGASAAEPLALLALEQRPQRGRLTAVLLPSSDTAVPVHALKIVGPGMHRVLTPAGQKAFPELPLTPHDRERWSRLIGALGEDTWQRLRSLRFCVVGVGRTGSAVAISLARMGIRHLTLIDPDHLELHNLDAMEGVTARDIGRFKVESVHEAAERISANIETTLLPDSITTLRALVQAKVADVLICCADNDGARLATGILATLYAKPLLDIGTGVFDAGAERQMGGDVRLILPGERCLLCFGGVADIERARRIFTAQPPPSRPAWHEERAGSLRSLNQIAAHLGVRLLEDLVGERVRQSRWLHVEFDHQGLPAVQVISPAPNPACLLCRHTGEGDTGLVSIRDMLSGLPEA